MGVAIIEYFTKEEDAIIAKEKYAKERNVGLERLIIYKEENGEFSLNID